MKSPRRFVVTALAAGSLAGAALLSVIGPGSAPARAASPREIAVTFDDLPAVSVAHGDLVSLAAFTDRLLAAIAAHQVPVVGFVNEGKLSVPGEGLAEQRLRIGLLQRWIAAGLELGNHTYSHRSLNEMPLDDFEADVLRGEPVTATLMAGAGRKLRYFRHPFLHVGLDLEKRQAFERWLDDRGYTVAPVTIDNDDYIFAAIYADALRSGGQPGAAKIAVAYLGYMDSVFSFNESLSQALFDRPIRPVLLLHANELNADHAGDVFALLRKRGYEFVPLSSALMDPAYRSPDGYVGRWGISWMHHWEQAMGRPRSGSPDPPAWVSAAYEKIRR